MLAPIVPYQFLFLRWGNNQGGNAILVSGSWLWERVWSRWGAPILKWEKKELILMLSWLQLILRREGIFLVRAESSWFFFTCVIVFCRQHGQIKPIEYILPPVDAQGIQVAVNMVLQNLPLSFGSYRSNFDTFSYPSCRSFKLYTQGGSSFVP